MVNERNSGKKLRKLLHNPLSPFHFPEIFSTLRAPFPARKKPILGESAFYPGFLHGQVLI
jgi:hypothetical protein